MLREENGELERLFMETQEKLMEISLENGRLRARLQQYEDISPKTDNGLMKLVWSKK